MEFLFVARFWVETKGKTLEELDAKFDGVKHSDAPDLEDVIKGKVDVSMIVGVEPVKEEPKQGAGPSEIIVSAKE